MIDDSFRQEGEEIKEILIQYRKMRSGLHHARALSENSFLRVIEYYDDNDKIEEAYEASDYAVQYYPFSSSLLLKKADLLIAKQRFSDAITLLEKVKSLDGSDMDLYILQMEAYLGISDTESAKEIFYQSMDVVDGQDKIDMLFQIADIFDDYGFLNEVFDCLKEILLKDHHNQEALYKICFWADYTSRFEDSIKLHNYLIDQDPYNHLAWFNLGTAYQGLKLYEKAIDAYLYSVTINEDFDYGYRNLGDAYIRVRNYRSAIEALDKVIELSIPEGVIYEALGYCYEKEKDWTQARTHYRKALHMNPEGDYLYYKIALTYMEQGDWHKAIRRIETALNIAPNKPEYHFSLGICYENTGLIEDALSSISKYIFHKPTVMKGWKELIRILFEYRYYTEASNECDEAIRQTNGKPVFLYYKAAILINQGRRKEGLIVLEDALAKAPKQFRDLLRFDPSIIERTSVVKILKRGKA